MSGPRTAGRPGFPISIPGLGDKGAEGISLRDWFAGQAMPGVFDTVSVVASWAEISEAAYRMADAMLAERAKTGTATVPLDRKQYDAPADLIPTALTNAAPEMYAALVQMVGRWEPDTSGTDRVMWEAARAALRKARGEPS